MSDIIFTWTTLVTISMLQVLRKLQFKCFRCHKPFIRGTYFASHFQWGNDESDFAGSAFLQKKICKGKLLANGKKTTSLTQCLSLHYYNFDSLFTGSLVTWLAKPCQAFIWIWRFEQTGSLPVEFNILTHWVTVP